jgi:hypothetical protein
MLPREIYRRQDRLVERSVLDVTDNADHLGRVRAPGQPDLTTDRGLARKQRRRE